MDKHFIFTVVLQRHWRYFYFDVGPPTNKVFNVSYGSISCILWNINGLKSKWDNDDLRIYLQQYDFIFLTETWATAKDTFSLKDYESY